MEELRRDVERVADRLRSLSAARLSAPCPPYGSVADAGRAVAAALAAAALVLEGRSARALPRLGDFAVGDQVAVAGQDLVAALSGGSGAADDASGSVQAAAEVLADVRRRV